MHQPEPRDLGRQFTYDEVALMMEALTHYIVKHGRVSMMYFDKETGECLDVTGLFGGTLEEAEEKVRNGSAFMAPNRSTHPTQRAKTKKLQLAQEVRNYLADLQAEWPLIEEMSLEEIDNAATEGIKDVIEGLTKLLEEGK